MALNKIYNRINWENYPSDATPLNETNLNKIDAAADEIDNRVISLDTTKFDKTEAQGLFKDVSLDRATGIITFTLYSGATKSIDTLLEKIAVNFDYNVETQQLIITLDDGEVKYIDLSALITQYEFLDSDTIAFSVNNVGKVCAIVKEGSIEEKHLQPNYLADIKVEVAKAQASQVAAATSEANAAASKNAAKTSETNANASEINAKASETSAASSAGTATAQAAAAKNSATSAATSATNAATSASTASTKATEASNSATSAASSASTATSKASAASTSASNAANSATEAESYAHGGTGTRENEDIDNAQYYYQQSKSISESFAGALRPMGTVAFANLPSLSAATEGDMYNVSDQFTTNTNFKEGSGLTIPAGANVYKTVDGYWDVLTGSPVTGVKGNAESSYRTGNVNLTPANIGLGNVPNVSTNNQTPTYTEASSLAELTSGEKLSVAFGKIQLAVKNVINIAKLLGTTDISAIGDGTVTGSIALLNQKSIADSYVEYKQNLGVSVYTVGNILTQMISTVGDVAYLHTTVDGSVVSNSTTDLSDFKWISVDSLLSNVENYFGVQLRTVIGDHGVFRYYPGAFANNDLIGFGPLLSYAHDTNCLYLSRIYTENGDIGSFACPYIPLGVFGFDLYWFGIKHA